MSGRILFGILAVCLVAIGAAGAIIVMRKQTPPRDRESETRANMFTTQLGVEDFGVQHDGYYPADVEMMVAHLPGAKRLKNAFTQDYSEPRQGPAPQGAPKGSVWYEPVRDTTGAVVSYRISGYGASGQIALILHSGE